MLTINIIVKNEESNIERCLNSVKNIADFWVLVDTGSTSEVTADLAMRVMSGIPGKIIYLNEFKDYSYARNIALDESSKNTWILSIDADEEFRGELPFLDDSASRYKVKISDGYQDFWNYILFNKKFGSNWVGPIHEIVEFEKEGPILESPDFYLHHYRSGTAMTSKEKFNFYFSKLLDDYESTGSPRSLFYLFKTLVETPYESVDLDKILYYGKKCLDSETIGNDEKYICSFFIGDVYFNKESFNNASFWYEKSLNYNRKRKESLARLMQIQCNLKNYEYAYKIGCIADIEYKSDFFVKLRDVNEIFWLYFELACYYSGRLNKAKEINTYLQATYPNNKLYKTNGEFY